MGFLSKLRDRVKDEIRPGNMPMQELRAGTFMPNSPQLDRRPSPRMPAPPARFDRATAPVLNPGNIGGNLGSDFRMPQKSGGAFGGAFRKLQEQLRNQQGGMGMPANPDGRVYAGGSPGLYAPGGRFNRGGRDRIMPNFGREQIPSNQGIPSLPQNLDFLSRLPPNMMPEVDFSNIPQLPENFQFNPQMGQGGRELNFADYKPQDRQMMAGGRDVNIDDGGMVDFLNSDPQQKLFGIENRIEMLLNQKREAEANGDQQSFDMIVQEINNADAQRIEIMNSMNPNPEAFPRLPLDDPRSKRMIEAGRGRTLSDADRMLGSEMGRTTSDIDDLLSSMEKKN